MLQAIAKRVADMVAARRGGQPPQAPVVNGVGTGNGGHNVGTWPSRLLLNYGNIAVRSIPANDIFGVWVQVVPRNPSRVALGIYTPDFVGTRIRPAGSDDGGFRLFDAPDLEQMFWGAGNMEELVPWAWEAFGPGGVGSLHILEVFAPTR